MKGKVAAVFAITLSASAYVADAVAKDTKGGAAVLIPAGDLKWGDVPGFAGLKMAVVQGDPAKGSARFMMRFPGGFAAPLHHHSAEHFVNVVSGTLVLTVDGKEHKLPAGSYFSFKGKKPHMTKCEAGADCVLALDTRGKWDIVPEETKGADKKK